MKQNLIISMLGVVILSYPTFAQNPAAQKAEQAPATARQEKKTPTQILTELGVFIYPKNQQTKEQQDKDASECLVWTKEQTGIDPAAPQESEAQPQQQQTGEQQQQQAKAPKGGAAKGAAGGAAAGAAIGAITGDAGTGAAVGATAGAMKGRRAQKKAAKAQKAEAEKQAQANQKAQEEAAVKQSEEVNSKLRKAFSACMDARGYSVK